MEASDTLGFISGSGLYSLDGFDIEKTWTLETPYGTASPISYGRLKSGRAVAFMNRHGGDRDTPPHLINYRANLWALSEAGVDQIVALNTVGGIHPFCGPGHFMVPNQVIDYTWGRAHTFAEPLTERFNHIDFTFPFDEALSQGIFATCEKLGMSCKNGGVYGCTQGPRLETGAEIQRLANDGCDVVGMTLMPEAALARELGLPYASLCSVVNWAAGLSDELISLEDIKSLMSSNADLLREFVLQL